MIRISRHWHSQRALNRTAVPSIISSWLLTNASMTQRMRETCRDRFSVQLLSQGWNNPNRDEALRIHIPTRERVVVREVKLLCDKQICMYARSLFPLKTLRSKGISLHKLGTRPLIDYLNLDPALQRSAYEIVKLHPGDYYYDQACSHLKKLPPYLWARRSVFDFFKQPILLIEVFMPNIFERKPIIHVASPIGKKVKVRE
jgi:chorismate--pyruvate lyase